MDSPTNPDLPVFTDPFDCDDFIQNHRCQRCWSTLHKVQPPESTAGNRKYIALCEHCGPQTTAYIRTRVVAWLERNNAAAAAEARRNLRQAVPWMRPQQSAPEILKELGYQ